MEKHTRHGLTPAAQAVFLDGNNVLLARRHNTGYEDGNYGLPAGHVEENETFTEAVIRETKEEVDLTIATSDIKPVHCMQRFQDAYMDVFFHIKKWEGTLKNTEPEKCDDVQWFPINDLPENTIPYIRAALGYIQEGVFYSEFGFSKN